MPFASSEQDNLHSQINDLETKVDDLESTLRDHESVIDDLADMLGPHCFIDRRGRKSHKADLDKVHQESRDHIDLYGKYYAHRGEPGVIRTTLIR